MTTSGRETRPSDVPFFVNDYTIWRNKESFYAKLGFEGPRAGHIQLVVDHGLNAFEKADRRGLFGMGLERCLIGPARVNEE
jgi:hypothetical protein